MRSKWKENNKRCPRRKWRKEEKKKRMKQKERGKYRRRNEEKAKSISGSMRGKDHKEGILKELFTKHLVQKS